MLQQFTKHFIKWLNRRSQRKSFNFREFNEKMNYYGLIKPRVMESKYRQLVLKIAVLREYGSEYI